MVCVLCGMVPDVQRVIVCHAALALGVSSAIHAINSHSTLCTRVAQDFAGCCDVLCSTSGIDRPYGITDAGV